MTGTIPERHKTFLDTLLVTLEKDPRIAAVLAGGSMVQGGFDAFSDLDLVIVVEPPAYADVMAGRREIAGRLGALMSAFSGDHVGEPRLFICLYGPELLHVDLKFVLLSDLTHLVERPLVLWAREEAAVIEALDRAVVVWPERVPQWFEDRAWTWLHYGATKLQRGELHETLAMISFFNEQVLGPMLQRRKGVPQRGLRKLEQAGIGATLAPLVAAYSPEDASRSLKAAAELYLDLRTDAPPERPVAGMPERLLPWLDLPFSARTDVR